MSKQKIIATSWHPSATNSIVPAIKRLIEDNKLVAIEYYLPNMPYRLKRFLLPFGANIK